MTRRHSHYFKPVSGLTHVDVYRVLDLFNVTDPCLQHAAKKILVAGGRGAGKDIGRDVQEAIDTLERWKEMQSENLQRGIANDTKEKETRHALGPNACHEGVVQRPAGNQRTDGC